MKGQNLKQVGEEWRLFVVKYTYPVLIKMECRDGDRLGGKV